MVKFYRQGDIVFRKIEQKINLNQINGTIVEKLIIKSERGNPHIIHSRCIVQEQDGTFLRGFLDSDTKVLVEHKEHGNFYLPAGQYIITRVREYDGWGLYGGTRYGLD